MSGKHRMWLLVTALMALLLAACTAAPAATPTTAPKPAPTSAPAAAPTAVPAPVPTKPAAAAPTAAPAPATAAPAAAQPIVLKYASTFTSGYMLAEPLQWFWKEVETRSKGAVKVEFYWAEALAKAPDVLDAVSSGLADIGDVGPAYTPAKTPLGTITTLPFLQINPGQVAAATAYTFASVPEMRAEVDKYGIRHLFTSGVDTYKLFSKTKPVRTLEDIKGMKIRGYGELNTWTGSAGGTAVAMTFPEIYTGLERGLVDATLHVYTTAKTYKWQEVVKYATEGRMGAVGNQYTAINLKSWAKIPADVQKIILDMAEKEYPKKLYDVAMKDEDDSRKSVIASGVQKIDLSDAEYARWKALADPIWTKWADNMDKQNLPGKKVLETWKTGVASFKP